MSCTVGLTKTCGVNSQTLGRLLEVDRGPFGRDIQEPEEPEEPEESEDVEGEEDGTFHNNHHRVGGARSDAFFTLGHARGIEDESLLDSVRNPNLSFAKTRILPIGNRSHRGLATPAGAAAKAQRSTLPLILFPPIFDTRLFYRSAHQPYVIHDQGSCASCVFISATTVAQVRAGIQLNKVNAAVVWRSILREERGGEEESAATVTEPYQVAVLRFAKLMRQQAEWGSKVQAVTAPSVAHSAYVPAAAAHTHTRTRTHSPRLRIPHLEWKQYICCETKSGCVAAGGGEGSRNKASGNCYHHKDEPSERAPFTCDVHADGVVPHHFLEWVSEKQPETRGFVDVTRRRIIKTIRPEHRNMTPAFSLIQPIELTSGIQLTNSHARLIAEQVRAIKASLMSNGPVMAMIRIEGKSFDNWGKIRRPKKGKEGTLGEHKEKEKEGEVEREREAEAEDEDEGGEEIDEEVDENSLLGQVRRRRAYRLPGRDQFDEYHEVTVVGWGYDDFGTPCWIIQNSYGPRFNSHCAVSPWTIHETDPWMSDTMETIQLGYEQSGVMEVRGCVFIEMINAELINSGCTTDLENNVLSFIPVIDQNALELYNPDKEIVDVYSEHVNRLRQSKDRDRGAAALAGSSSAADDTMPDQQGDVSGAVWIWVVAAMLVGVAVVAVWLNHNQRTQSTIVTNSLSAASPPAAAAPFSHAPFALISR